MGCGLCRGIARHAALPHHPAHRPEIDNRATPGLLHHRGDRLNGKKRRADIDRLAFIPIFRRYVLPFMAGVIGGIIKQCRDRAVGLGSRCHRILKRLDIGNVACDEKRLVFRGLSQLFNKRMACFLGNVDKGDFRALLDKGGDKRLANARGTAGNENRFIGKAGIVRWHAIGHDRRLSRYLVFMCRSPSGYRSVRHAMIGIRVQTGRMHPAQSTVRDT